MKVWTRSLGRRFVTAMMLLGLVATAGGCHHKRVRRISTVYRVAQPDDHDFNAGR